MGHDYQDRVSLEIARRIAEELPGRPEWLAHARENLDRAMARNPGDSAMLRACKAWREILNSPVEQVIATLTAETEEGQRLRQNSPFAGVLSPQEVWEIKRQFRNDQSAA